MPGLATYRFDGRQWFVVQAQCGYITKASLNVKSAHHAGEVLDEAFLANRSVDSKLLSSIVDDFDLPNRWRIAEFDAGGEKFYDIVDANNKLWGTDSSKFDLSINEYVPYDEASEAADVAMQAAEEEPIPTPLARL